MHDKVSLHAVWASLKLFEYHLNIIWILFKYQYLIKYQYYIIDAHKYHLNFTTFLFLIEAKDLTISTSETQLNLSFCTFTSCGYQ